MLFCSSLAGLDCLSIALNHAAKARIVARCCQRSALVRLAHSRAATQRRRACSYTMAWHHQVAVKLHMLQLTTLSFGSSALMRVGIAKGKVWLRRKSGRA